MSLFLAIDGGGSRTRCWLADDTRVLARAEAGTVKPMRISEQEATDRLRAMLTQVAASAGASLGHVTRTCFGLAGLSSPAVRAWASKALPAIVHGEIILCGDEEIALDAAFADGPGILVVAGTGSNAIGRTAAGQTFGAGGWGPVLGDEGSGTWIGLEALRAALRAYDSEVLSAPQRSDRCGGQRSDRHSGASCDPVADGSGDASTFLLREIARYWKLGSLGELVCHANRRADPQHPAPDFASLAPVVARCAEGGDARAADVLARAGEELAELVALVFRKMNAAVPSSPDLQSQGLSTTTGSSPGAGSAIGVAFTGGVLTHIAPVRAAMTARLAVRLPAAQVRPSPVDPLEGALGRARRG